MPNRAGWTTEEWLEELRSRTHKLTSSCAALELTNKSLDKKVTELTEEIRRMATADAIAKGVTEELHRRDAVRRSMESQERSSHDRRFKAWVAVVGTLVAAANVVGVVFK